MTPTQYTFVPVLFETIEDKGYGELSFENWKQLTNYNFPKQDQQYYIREFGKMLQVITADLQRNVVIVECV